MIPVFLSKVKTRDGLILEGAVSIPRGRRREALVWLHGLTSRFSSGQDLMRVLIPDLAQNGIGYFKFNNRGHDIVARGTKKLAGTAFERFEDSVYDIRAVVGLARKLGFKKIILAGHSTGANKVAFYAARMRDRAIKGVILIAPMSDIAAEIKRAGQTHIDHGLTIAWKLAKKNPRQFMPREFGMYSSTRYISLFTPGKAEDTFPYYNVRARWKTVGKIRPPILAIIGSRDEHLDRTPQNYIEAFRTHAPSAKNFSGIIIKGARHGFYKKEKELTNAIINWIKKSSRRKVV